MLCNYIAQLLAVFFCSLALDTEILCLVYLFWLVVVVYAVVLLRNFTRYEGVVREVEASE